MPSSLRVRLALLLACALMPFIAQAKAGHRAPENHIHPSPQQADMSPSAARRDWDERRDWTYFTTRVLGDAAVTGSMKALLASGLSPDTRDKYGRTALHAAVLLAQPELTRLLLSKSADVNARDREGRTPLMISASAGGFDHFGSFAPSRPGGGSGASRSATWRGPRRDHQPSAGSRAGTPRWSRNAPCCGGCSRRGRT